MMDKKFATGFQSLFDFTRPRSGVAVFGFYLFYLIVGSFLLSFIGIAVAKITAIVFEEQNVVSVLLSHSDSFGFMMLVYNIFGIAYCGGLHLLIVRLKKQGQGQQSIAGKLIVTAVLCLIGTPVLGLMPPAKELNANG